MVLESQPQHAGIRGTHQRIRHVLQIRGITPQRQIRLVSGPLNVHEDLMRRAVTPLIPQRFKGLDQPFGVIHITRIDLREPGSAFPVQHRHLSGGKRPRIVQIRRRTQLLDVIHHAPVAHIGQRTHAEHLVVLTQHAHAQPRLRNHHAGDIQAARLSSAPSQHAVCGEPVHLRAMVMHGPLLFTLVAVPSSAVPRAAFRQFPRGHRVDEQRRAVRGLPHEQRLGSVVDQVVQPYRHAVFAYHGRRSLHEPPTFRNQIAHQRRCGRADGGGPAAATVYVISQDKQPVVQRIPPFGMGAGLTHGLGRGQLPETPFQTVDRLQESDGVHCQDSHDVPFAAPYATAGRSGRLARTGHSGTPRSAVPQAFGNLWICG